MKPTDFINEDHNIVQAVVEMHDDHEVQMAREQCYHAASNAIELHRMLKHFSERQGLEGWVSEKITIANEYLRTVKEYLEYEIMSGHQGPGAQPMREMASAGATSSGGIATSFMAPKKKRVREEDKTAPVPKSKVPAYMRKQYHGPDWKVSAKDIEQEPEQKNLISHPTVLRRNIGAVK